MLRSKWHELGGLQEAKGPCIIGRQLSQLHHALGVEWEASRVKQITVAESLVNRRLDLKILHGKAIS